VDSVLAPGEQPAYRAVVSGVLNRFGLGFKIFDPLAKLLPQFVPHGDPLQLSASIGQSPKFSRVHIRSAQGKSGQTGTF